MLIAKDRSSGAERLRFETDDDTFWLTCALVLKRLARTDRARASGELHHARWWVEGAFIKRFGPGTLTFALSACFSLPLALFSLALRWFLFGTQPKKVCLPDSIFHACSMAERVIK